MERSLELSGGRFLGAGTYGCVFAPPLADGGGGSERPTSPREHAPQQKQEAARKRTRSAVAARRSPPVLRPQPGRALQHAAPRGRRSASSGKHKRKRSQKAPSRRRSSTSKATAAAAAAATAATKTKAELGTRWLGKVMLRSDAEEELAFMEPFRAVDPHEEFGVYANPAVALPLDADAAALLRSAGGTEALQACHKRQSSVGGALLAQTAPARQTAPAAHAVHAMHITARARQHRRRGLAAGQAKSARSASPKPEELRQLRLRMADGDLAHVLSEDAAACAEKPWLRPFLLGGHLRALRALMRGLDAYHNKGTGVVHLDIKCQNIVVFRDAASGVGECAHRYIDFGMARCRAAFFGHVARGEDNPDPTLMYATYPPYPLLANTYFAHVDASFGAFKFHGPRDAPHTFLRTKSKKRAESSSSERPYLPLYDDVASCLEDDKRLRATYGCAETTLAARDDARWAVARATDVYALGLVLLRVLQDLGSIRYRESAAGVPTFVVASSVASAAPLSAEEHGLPLLLWHRLDRLAHFVFRMLHFSIASADLVAAFDAATEGILKNVKV
jgi:hypothetical protein